MTIVVCILLSKSAKQNITFSPGFFSLGIKRTDLKPGKGLKMCATSLSVASKGIPSTYTVLVALKGIGKMLGVKMF